MPDNQIIKMISHSSSAKYSLALNICFAYRFSYLSEMRKVKKVIYKMSVLVQKTKEECTTI